MLETGSDVRVQSSPSRQSINQKAPRDGETADERTVLGIHATAAEQLKPDEIIKNSRTESVNWRRLPSKS